ncbi:hypothetical protein C1646_666987 [Rhizophagus diaphanus]|nr:hypothetical protein C1646_666987 [Rhizophagus diaphanus] [Rhizophagus sp. MUCL 43196]
MKQKNGNQYSASSVRCAIAAIYCHLMKYFTISGINIHDQATFPTFWEVTNGKLKLLSDLGLNDAKGIQGKEHSVLLLEDFKKREDGGEKNQLRMMENLAEKITGNDKKSCKKFQKITTNLNNSNETSEFDNNNNTFK